jgi:hypothetical protein
MVPAMQLYKPLQAFHTVHGAIPTTVTLGDVGVWGAAGCWMVPKSWSGFALANDQAMQGRIDPTGLLTEPHSAQDKCSDW